MHLTVTYALLALIATAANIGSQDVAIRLYHGTYGVLLSVAIGTGVGLIVKYVLDKMYIFRFRARDALDDSQTFALYALTGIVTTAIFWGFEFWFDHVFQTKEWRYLGGALGLAIGYATKYQLDKRFVFRRSRLEC